MIKITILESNDTDALGSRTFFTNLIYLGSKKGDVLAKDPEIINYHFKFEVIANELFGFLHPQLKNFHHNGKISSKKIRLAPNDKIKFGQTVIEINSFELTLVENFKQMTNEKLDALIESDSPLLGLLKSIEEEMEK